MHDHQRLLTLSLLAYATQKDLSAERLCVLSGIDYKGLREEPQLNLTLRQSIDLWLNATHLSGDPLFGLHFGESLQVAALGVVGELIRNSRTVGEALTHAAAFTHLITDAVDMTIDRTDESFSIHLVLNRSQVEQGYPAMGHQLMDFLMAFVIHEIDGLVMEKIRPSSATLAYAEVDRLEYERVPRCNSICQSNDYTLKFNNLFWDEPILMANYELQGLLLQKVSAMEWTLETTRKMSDRLSRYLLSNANMGIPPLEAIAANFNTSPRSLQRKLQEEGITYQQIADSIRKTLAIHFLELGQHPVKEVSYILGYNEMSAFARAFKRWTGHTPGGYQKRRISL